MGAILHDFLHALMHVDRSALSLVRMLIVEPGRVARDYVDGKRQRHFGPFGFLVVTVGLATAVIEILRVRLIVAGTQDTGAFESVGALLRRHSNALILVQVPVLAAFSRALFRKQRINFAEQLVLASYTSGMRSLVSTLFVLPFAYMFGLTGAGFLYFYAGYVIVWFAYFGFAMGQFLREPGLWPPIKGALAAFLAFVTTQIAFTMIVNALVRYSSHG